MISSVPFRRCLGILFAMVVFFFILTASIGLPIYLRPFYYAHIDAMDLPRRSGFTREQIVEAYDEVLDYLTLPLREFGTGAFACSARGKSHFADCKVLFGLNTGVLIGSILCMAGLFLLRRRCGPYRLGRRSAAFYGAAAAIVLPVVIGSLAALDFDRAFVIFHSLFFPGKDNWLFDYHTDQIILVLPQDFFMHCALLIGLSVLVMSASVILWDTARRRKEHGFSA